MRLCYLAIHGAGYPAFDRSPDVECRKERIRTAVLPWHASLSLVRRGDKIGTEYTHEENILRLSGRRIVITGAASGIGRAIAELFAREGAKVAALDLNLAGAEAVARAISGVAVAVDVTSEESVNRAIEAAGAALGGIDGLVNSAGINLHSLIENTAFSDWQRVLAVNLNGPFLVCRAAIPWLRKAESATIVSLASAAAVAPFVGNSAYAASKAGLMNFNRSLAKELAPGVRANVLCPGIVDTPMSRGMLKARDPAVDVTSQVADQLALKRKGRPEEIAAAALFLSCSESSFATGSALVIDGGRAFY
jgi:NAD(P)-dependent dehydrogenase (short-subunit alcohol dehydrogenase family)